MAITTDALVCVKRESYALLKVRNCRENVAVMLLPSDFQPSRDAFDDLRVGQLVEIAEIVIGPKGARAYGVTAVLETDARYAMATCVNVTCCARFMVIPGFSHSDFCDTCKAAKHQGRVKTPITAGPLAETAADIINSTVDDEPIGTK